MGADLRQFTISDDIKALLKAGENQAATEMQLSGAFRSEHYETSATTDTDTLLRFASEVYLSSPVGWWRFDEASGLVANDNLGTNDGSYFGAVTLGFPGAVIANVTGDTDSAVGDLGSGAYVLIPPASNNTFGPDEDFAVEIFFTTTASTAVIVHKTVSGTWPYRLEVVASKLVGSRSDGTNTPTVTSAASVDDAAWHYALLSKSSSTLTLTLDAATASTTDTTTGGVGATANSGDILLASSAVTAVDEFAIYAAAISDAAGQRHYSAARGIRVAL